MLANLEELTEVITSENIRDLIQWYPHKSVLQRLGFILDEVYANNNLASLLFTHLQKEKFYPVLLSPRKNQKAGAVDNRWKVDVNLELESDL